MSGYVSSSAPVVQPFKHSRRSMLRIDERLGADEVPVMEQASYEALAAFRFEIRHFFSFSTRATEAAGLPPVQYQAMLAIKAHGDREAMTVSGLAAEMFIKVQTAVELVGRLDAAGLVIKVRNQQDRRRMGLSLTPEADSKLAALAAVHLNELQVLVPNFITILSRIAEPN